MYFAEVPVVIEILVRLTRILALDRPATQAILIPKKWGRGEIARLRRSWFNAKDRTVTFRD